MPEEPTKNTTEMKGPSKPDWLEGMNPQAELIKIWNDVFESDCNCEICKRLRKALSRVQTPPTTTLSK